MNGRARKAMNNQENVKIRKRELADDELEQISGGCDWGEDDNDYSNTICHWNPDGKDHVFEEGADGIIRCKYCDIHF